MIPSAPAMGSTTSSLDIPTTPFSIVSMGRRTPITPVDDTSTLSAVEPISAAAAAAMRRAFSRPTAPVATLLTLLLAKIARRVPPLIVSRPRRTGAPGNLLRVNTAAAAASTSLTNSARSFAVGLRPMLRLAQRNPRGKTGRSWNGMAARNGGDSGDASAGSYRCTVGQRYLRGATPELDSAGRWHDVPRMREPIAR